jgi:hypothetical protein
LQKLYLVGLTSDLSGLVLSRQRGVKSGGFVVDLDDQLRARLSELYRRHAEAGSRDAAPAGIEEVVPEPELPAEGAAGEVSPRRNAVRSVLTPKEIQAELRSGKTVQEVAGLAGTDTSWIERFLSPILAERRGIVDAVMTGFISRPRQGRSSCNVGQAIVANLRERKAAISPEDLEEGWIVARRNGHWEVTFRYSLRGQHKQAQFAYDPEGGVTAMDEEASVIGWRPPASTRAGAGGRPEGEPSAAPKAPVGAVAAAKPKAKTKPAPRGDVAAATAALWGATKVTPPTAPARRSSFIGVRKTDAGAGPSKPAAKAGPKAPARPEPARTPARSEPAKAAGRQPPAQPGTRQPPVPAGQPDKRPPGAAEDRSVVAHNSASPRPKRLITVEDDEADWRSALAKTRAKRKAAAPGPHQGAPAPKPAPKPAPRPSSQPARPQRKRLPDDWLIGE